MKYNHYLLGILFACMSMSVWALDMDGDGMPDEWESLYGLNTTYDDSMEDADFDGVANLMEYQNNTDPTEKDTDGDTLTDYQELFPISRIPIFDDSPWLVGISDTGQYLLYTGMDGQGYVYDRATALAEKFSVSTNNEDADDWISGVGISADGRYVVFSSMATNLVSGDNNSDEDVFLRDRQLGTTISLSKAVDGGDAHGGSYGPVISGNGKYVAYTSNADNLVSEDWNNDSDVFLYEISTGVTQLQSINDYGYQCGSYCHSPRLSFDGKVLTYLEGGYWDNGGLYINDLEKQIVTAVQVSFNNTIHGNNLFISRSGQYVGFTSNWMPSTPYSNLDRIFMYDRNTATTSIVSQDDTGDVPNNDIDWGVSSADGSVIVFSTWATDMVSGDLNAKGDVFVRDVNNNTNTIVSNRWNGQQTNGYVGRNPYLSTNGRYVIFPFEQDDPEMVPFTIDNWSPNYFYIYDRQQFGLSPTNPDSDGDGIDDGVDLFPSDPLRSLDTDMDGLSNYDDPDVDNDEVDNELDNCSLISNSRQDNLDGDSYGDVCDDDVDGDGALNDQDPDDDNDTVPDVSDSFPYDPSESADNDLDGMGDNADLDDDNDTILDIADNCVLVSNIDQADMDGDGLGDLCDPDIDNDGLSNNVDTDDDNDGVEDISDDFPTDPAEWLDTDNDGIGNNADLDDDNDKMTDQYELNYALDPLDPADSVLDGDADGLNNYQEFLANTDPGSVDTDNDGLLDKQEVMAVERISVSSSGAEGNGDSASHNEFAVSDNGAFVVFQSVASNLVENDNNAKQDIFLKNLLSNVIMRMSVSDSNQEANGTSRDPVISGNGRYVIFQSNSTNLVAGYGSSYGQIYLKDTLLNTLEIVSISSGGQQASSYGAAGVAVVSNDGRFVVFQSQASNLDPIITNSNYGRWYVRDRVNSTTHLVTYDENNQPYDGGQVIGFVDDTNNIYIQHGNVYRHNLETLESQMLLSSAYRINGGQAAVNKDGSFIVFSTNSPNPPSTYGIPTNPSDNIFLFDTKNGSLERITNAAGSNSSNNPKISADGRYILYASDQSNLVPEDTNNLVDLFVYDRQVQTTIRVNVSDYGIQSNAYTGYGYYSVALSRDGRYVVFSTMANSLINSDTNNALDIYRVDIRSLQLSPIISDTDGDGTLDGVDWDPLNVAESIDTDSDGMGNNADWDDDNDGVPDVVDAAPFDAGNSVEITLPLNGAYKGSSLQQGIQAN